MSDTIQEPPSKRQKTENKEADEDPDADDQFIHYRWHFDMLHDRPVGQ